MATLENTPTALMPVAGKSQIEGIPAEYDDGKQWLRNGFRRQPRAVIIGLLLANTGVWLALWGALIGAFVGLLIGMGLVTKTSGSFYSQAASHAVGPFSIVGGL